ncbi:hypothetical protein Tsp_08888 [Trichinella spiralis]|uniref:hypothetical protein n=1 Tax=Trichinella spiralis TaxID=6334 RepID=UPI0001EFEA72|nr:hypothetical protein Tsp_08888 [Trichinella spiralis]
MFCFDNEIENKLRVSGNFKTYHWLNYEKGADSTIVTSRAVHVRNTMIELIVHHDPVELGYRSRHIWTCRSVAEYGSGQTLGSDWWCAVLVSDRSCCDFLLWLLAARCDKHLKRLFGVRFINYSHLMSSSRRVGVRKVNSNGEQQGVV